MAAPSAHWKRLPVNIVKRKNAWVSFIIVHLSFQIKTTKAGKNDILYGLTVRVKAADIDYHDYTQLVFYTAPHPTGVQLFC